MMWRKYLTIYNKFIFYVYINEKYVTEIGGKYWQPLLWDLVVASEINEPQNIGQIAGWNIQFSIKLSIKTSTKVSILILWHKYKARTYSHTWVRLKTRVLELEKKPYFQCWMIANLFLNFIFIFHKFDSFSNIWNVITRRAKYCNHVRASARFK